MTKKTKVVFRRDEEGDLEPVDDRQPTIAHTEAPTKPEVGDDPRPAAIRNIPPFGPASA